jgi:hypothetical protein
MRIPLSGIVTGFRIGKTKDSDFAQLDILQVGTKEYMSNLTFVYVEQTEHIDYLLTNYISGQLRWINVYVVQIQQGRETIWLLKDIFDLSKETLEVIN